MTILWITPGFAGHEQDYSCIPVLQLLARSLQKMGVKLHILTVEYPSTAQRYTWNGIPVYPCNGRNRRWRKPYTWWLAQKIGQKILQTEQIDVLHSFWLGRAFDTGETLAKPSGLPHTTTLMGQDVLPDNQHRLNKLNTIKTQQLIAVSQYQAAVFQKSTGMSCGNVIPWGLALEEISDLSNTQRPIHVLGVGSLIPVKNWEKWLEVIRILRINTPAIRAELVGEGPLFDALQEKIQEWGLTENVRLLGALPRPEVLKKMQTARVLLHTSRYESYGFVFPEAAAAGCHIVGTPVGVATVFGATAETPEGLSEQVNLALQSRSVMQSPTPPNMDDTAAQYLKIWELAVTQQKWQ